MDQLTAQGKRLKTQCIEKINAYRNAERQAFLGIAHWLLIADEHELWSDEEECNSLADWAGKHFGFKKSHVYRFIAAKQAHDDVLDVQSPIGDSLLDPPQTESVARELAKAISPQERANVWTAANKLAGNLGKDDTPIVVSAAHVAKARKAMFSPLESDNGEDVEKDVEDEGDEPFWKQCAGRHADALNHLTQAIKAINWIEKQGEAAAYLAPVITRIRTDYKTLRGTISQNCPAGEKAGKIVTKVMERK